MKLFDRIRAFFGFGHVDPVKPAPAVVAKPPQPVVQAPKPAPVKVTPPPVSAPAPQPVAVSPPPPAPSPTPTAVPAPPPAPLKPSPDGATISGEGKQIVDAGLAVWILAPPPANLGYAGLGIYRDGVFEADSQRVTLLLWWKNFIYYQNVDGDWWYIDGLGWHPCTDPRLPAPAPVASTPAPKAASTATPAPTPTPTPTPPPGSAPTPAPAATPTPTSSPASLAPPAAAAAALPRLAYGVNIGAGTDGDEGEDVYWTNYVYPQPAEIALAKGQGVTMLRIGFNAARVFDKVKVLPDAANLLTAVDEALADGMTVILDCHDYGHGIPYSTTLTIADAPWIVTMWKLVFGKYAGNPAVVPSFMNEPAALGTNMWALAQAWITGLRVAGFTGPLVVPMEGWSPLAGYGDATLGAKAAVLADPASSLIFDGHIYFDFDGSGTHNDVMGFASVAAVTRDAVRAWLDAKLGASLAWARAGKRRFLIGETALPDTDIGNAVRPLLVEWLNDNRDALWGVTWWILASWMDESFYLFGMSKGGAASPIFTATTKAYGALAA